MAARAGSSPASASTAAQWRTVGSRRVTKCEGGQLHACLRPLGRHRAQRHRPISSTWRSTPTCRTARSAATRCWSPARPTAGRSWSGPITLIQDPDGQALNDKNSITADDTDANYAYAVWDRLRDFTLPPQDGGGAGAAPPRLTPARATAWSRRATALQQLGAGRGAQRGGPGRGSSSRARSISRAPPTPGGPGRRRGDLRPRPELADHQQPGRGAAEWHGDRLLHRDHAERRHADRADPLVRQGSHVGAARAIAAAIATVYGVVTPDTQELVRDARSCSTSRSTTERQPLPRLAGRPLPRRRRGGVRHVHGRRRPLVGAGQDQQDPGDMQRAARAGVPALGRGCARTASWS